MLTHLDDPSPYVPSVELRAGVARRARVLRRRRRVVGAICGAVCLLSPIAGIVTWLHLQPTRVDVIVPAQPTTIAVASPTSAAAISGTTTVVALPTNILVVGLDSQPGVDGARGDTILVVRLDQAAAARRVLAIPRDLRVSDPDTGKDVRINSLVGRRAKLVQLVQQITGVHIDHYVELGLDAFAQLGDAIGGIDLTFDTPLRDLHTGFEAPAGCMHLDGGRLRAYVRSRYVETFDGKRWTSDATSEFGRVARMGDLVQRVVTQVLDGGSVDLAAVVEGILPKLTVDSGLGLGEARRLVAVARSMAGVPVEWSTLPTTLGKIVDGNGAPIADVLELADPAFASGFLTAGGRPATALSGGPPLTAVLPAATPQRCGG